MVFLHLHACSAIASGQFNDIVITVQSPYLQSHPTFPLATQLDFMSLWTCLFVAVSFCFGFEDNLGPCLWTRYSLMSCCEDSGWEYLSQWFVQCAVGTGPPGLFAGMRLTGRIYWLLTGLVWQRLPLHSLFSHRPLHWPSEVGRDASTHCYVLPQSDSPLRSYCKDDS